MQLEGIPMGFRAPSTEIVLSKNLEKTKRLLVKAGLDPALFQRALAELFVHCHGKSLRTLQSPPQPSPTELFK